MDALSGVKTELLSMRNGYTGLWTLLAISFITIVAVSAFDSINVMGFELKTSGIISRITEPYHGSGCQDESVAVADSMVADTEKIPFPVPVDTASQRILLIGDSMLEGLSPRLAAYAKQNGHELYTVIWYSSTSQIWGECDTLSTFIRKFRPTYIMVSLGANELFVRDIERKRDRYVKSILEQIGEIPYLWIGPPNWKEDTGINRLVEKNVAKGAFFLSDGMHFDRARDGAHPTRSSAAEWLDSIARWMPDNCNHPIRLLRPDNGVTARAKRIIVLQPKK